MPLVTMLWSMVAAAGLMLALVHLIVWLRRRDRWAHLTFAFLALSVVGYTLCDLGFETARSPQAYARAMWLVEFTILAYFVAVVLFVRTYLKAGPMWLGALVVGARVVFVVLNLGAEHAVNYSRIESIEHVVVLGESLAVPVGQLSGWRMLGEISELGLFVFLLLTTVAVWRRGERRKAILTSGSNAVFMLLGAGHAALVFHGILPPPMMVVPSFLFVITAMNYDLSSGLLEAADLAETLQASEAKLRESEQRMELAGRAAELGHWVWDMRTGRIWATEIGRVLYGIGLSEDLTFERFVAALHPEDRDAVERRIADSVRAGEDFNAEYRVVAEGGAIRWILARGRTEFDAAGQPVQMRGVSLDVTQRRLAEELALQIVEASPNSIIVASTSGVIRHVNASAQRMFARDRGDMIGCPIHALIPLERRASAQADDRAWLAALLLHPAGGEREVLGVRGDGEAFPIEISVGAIQTTQGPSLLITIIDVTERKQAELESARQRNELAHLSRVTMLSELSGSLAHELNQPLASILSNAQAAQQFMAGEDFNPDEVREILQDIVDEDKRAGEVIRRLRMLLKKGEVQHEPLDINQTLQDVLRLVRSDLINHGVRTRLDLAPGLPRVVGDTIQLQQVLLNLVMNACDAMSATPADERVLRMTTEVRGAAVDLRISDRGCGVPEGRLEQIFEPFVTSKAEGMGLGLAVCRTIVTMHKGRLWATNNAEGGATFHLTLPTLSGGA